MPRYTKKQAVNHNRACELVHSDKALTTDEREFILENWLPGRDQSTRAAFFTPTDWAQSIALNAQCSTPATYADLGAGIGTLTYWLWKYMQWDRSTRDASTFHCIEESEEFTKVGKRVLPEVEWHHGSAFDPLVWMTIGAAVDVIICNPPYGEYGAKPPKTFSLQRTPRHLQFVALAAERSTCGGVFILPSPCLPFEYDNKKENSRHKYKDPDGYSPALRKLLKQYPALRLNCIPWQLSLDFDGAKPNVNLVSVDLESSTEWEGELP